jgi:hypothetical protein
MRDLLTFDGLEPGLPIDSDHALIPDLGSVSTILASDPMERYWQRKKANDYREIGVTVWFDAGAAAMLCDGFDKSRSADSEAGRAQRDWLIHPIGMNYVYCHSEIISIVCGYRITPYLTTMHERAKRCRNLIFTLWPINSSDSPTI